MIARSLFSRTPYLKLNALPGLKMRFNYIRYIQYCKIESQENRIMSLLKTINIYDNLTPMPPGTSNNIPATTMDRGWRHVRRANPPPTKPTASADKKELRQRHMSTWLNKPRFCNLNLKIKRKAIKKTANRKKKLESHLFTRTKRHTQ